MALRSHRRAYGKARTSPQRRVIVDTIERVGRAFTVDEITHEIAKRRRIGTATVYRAISALEDSGWLARVGERDSHVLYAKCDRSDHHHHLVCTECGAVARTRCLLDKQALEAAGRAGFQVTQHEITLYGLCRECRQPSVAEAG